MIDHGKLKENLERIAALGVHPDGGTNRVFGSENYILGQTAAAEYFRDCGMESYVDTAGNVHGILAGSDPDGEEIWMGSHLDTVTGGGRFDGLLGVVAAAEAVRAVKESGMSIAKTLHVIGTNGEEGNAMGGTFGSRAMMDMLPLDDEKYLAIGQKFGYTREALKKAAVNTDKAVCWLELHIEQGPTLDKYGEQIGVVTGIVGLRRFNVRIKGQTNHSGTTMMADRNDALVSAAKLIVMGDALARELGCNFVETVSNVTVYPGATAVIPGGAEFVVEIRNEDDLLMDRFEEEYRQRAAVIAECTMEPIVSKAPIRCDPRLIAAFENACKQVGAVYRSMPSGATHDGNAMASRMAVGMIFVPSVNGISHAANELTQWDDIFTGADVFYNALIQLLK